MSIPVRKIMGYCIAALIISLILLTGFAHAEAGALFREDFHNLDNWEPLAFPKIERHTAYSADREGCAHF